MDTTGGTGAGGRLADKSYVIVALPKADDEVHSLSTEKKPHLTLLYLGPKLDNPKRVEQFLRYAAANTQGDFFLTVKNRGPLGPDKADVLFFDRYRLKEIEDFRAHLRSNPDIEKAYLSTIQYPEWVPHLTLGYPETPTEPMTGPYLPVTFDRLALWSGDCEGPEFPLREDSNGMKLAAHSDDGFENEFAGFLDALETELNLLDEEDLTHFGVKGMKWGVRKEDRPALASLGPDRIERKTASGKTIVMTKDAPTRLHQFLARISSNYRKEYESAASLTLRDSSGKRIGDAQVHKKNKDELYLVWLGIDRSARGQGYATAAVKAAKEFGRQQGFKKLTLEVPGNSPDARHIYEKLGFKADKTQPQQGDDSIWGGLTSMTLDVEKTVRHTDAEAFLSHYGVKGMRWGVRKTDAPGVSRGTNREARKDAQEFARAKMFYGEGAGTRRKLIKAKVEGKSSRDPSYKKAFDHHIDAQDMSRHAERARGERRRKDVTNTTAKTARGVSHILRGNSQYASALATGVFAAGMAAHKTGIDRMILDAGKKTMREVRRGVLQNGPKATAFLRNMGV